MLTRGFTSLAQGMWILKLGIVLVGRDTGVFGRHLSRAFLKDEKQSLEGLAYQCKKPYPSGISVWQCQAGVYARAAQSEVPLADVLRGHAYWDMILPSITPFSFLLEQLEVASSYHSCFLIGVRQFPLTKSFRPP